MAPKRSIRQARCRSHQLTPRSLSLHLLIPSPPLTAASFQVSLSPRTSPLRTVRTPRARSAMRLEEMAALRSVNDAGLVPFGFSSPSYSAPDLASRSRGACLRRLTPSPHPSVSSAPSDIPTLLLLAANAAHRRVALTPREPRPRPNFTPATTPQPPATAPLARRVSPLAPKNPPTITASAAAVPTTTNTATTSCSSLPPLLPPAGALLTTAGDTGNGGGSAADPSAAASAAPPSNAAPSPAQPPPPPAPPLHQSTSPPRRSHSPQLLRGTTAARSGSLQTHPQHPPLPPSAQTRPRPPSRKQTPPQPQGA